jgi:DNA repair protein RecO (recombination protein O)
MRVKNTPGFVLLNRPFGETSWIVEVFSREYGRLALMAKGARTKKSKYRGMLQPFQPLMLSWSGKGEIPLLTGAETTDGFNELVGQSMICGFYLNELIYRLLTRHDPHRSLFDQYTIAMDRLQNPEELHSALRTFEFIILRETGYELRLDCDFESGEAIQGGVNYRYVNGRGVIRFNGTQVRDDVYSGHMLRALVSGKTLDSTALGQAKHLLRVQLSHLLGRRDIVSRTLYQASFRE